MSLHWSSHWKDSVRTAVQTVARTTPERRCVTFGWQAVALVPPLLQTVRVWPGEVLEVGASRGGGGLFLRGQADRAGETEATLDPQPRGVHESSARARARREAARGTGLRCERVRGQGGGGGRGEEGGEAACASEQGKRRAEGVSLNTLSASGSKSGDVDPGGASGISRGSQNGFFPGRSRLLPALSLHPALALNKGPRGRRRKHGEGPERRGTREAYAGKCSPLRVCRLPRDLEWLLSLLALQFREMTFSCARRECYFKRLEKSLEWLPKIRSLFQRPQEATSRTLIPKRRPRSGMWLGDQFGIAKLSAFIKAETPWLFKTFDKDFL
ncbi:uncharacterized protein LOC126941076 [Macaca thibetana thibetana]|uniref:uncharacterized protein LOC126941076 n=1 Tax=Macaca thibetana thibetana TaxID=257877 RepID=UPI0021BCDF02|nr:uncharacterized protein LOC126941076 [Macaca thibetana thibetana]